MVFFIKHCIVFSSRISYIFNPDGGSQEFAGGWPLAVGRWVDDTILKWNYRLIGKFSVCWVPDWTGSFSLAGKLSHPAYLPSIPVKYIGILSRFKNGRKKDMNNSLLILLSGPEPQRTEFENIFWFSLLE